MNEINDNTNNATLLGISVLVVLIVCICAGIVYYYRGADQQLERELSDVERLNHELAAETRQLQAGIASHIAGIKNVRGAIGTSRKRVEHVYTEIEQSAKSTDRAIEIIAECEEIIKAIKTQR